RRRRFLFRSFLRGPAGQRERGPGALCARRELPGGGPAGGVSRVPVPSGKERRGRRPPSRPRDRVAVGGRPMRNEPFLILPAIDLRDGRAVRLRQGEANAETRYSEDPVEVA